MGMESSRNSSTSDSPDSLRRRIVSLEDGLEKQRAKIAKLTSELSRWREIVQRAPDGLALVAGGRIVVCSRRLASMLGCDDAGAVEGKGAAELFPESDCGRLSALLSGTSRSGAPARMECALRRADGKSLSVEAAVSPPFEPAGGGVYVVAAFRDITRRKIVEEETVRTQRLESLGILAGGIAHDFNNILTAILGNISLTRMSVDEDRPEYQTLKDAQNACLQAQALTRQLLTFAKGGVPLKRVASIGHIVRESVSLAVRGSNVRCSVSIPPDLRHAEVDEAQLTQTLNNLLINANQAMPDGGEVSVVCENATITEESASSLSPGEYVRITVRDQGAGIPDEQMQHIFDPYFTTKEDGSGLGLAIAYSVVRKHGGFITARSQVGSGTSVVIYIPATGSRVADAEQVSEEELIRGEGRVLVMDDQESVRSTTAKLVRELGYDVETAPDGQRMVEKYREAMNTDKAFSALIVDLTVPGRMGGKEAMRRVLEIDPGAKGIVFSGYSNDPVIADHARYGFKGVVRKPFQPHQLAATLSRVIASK